jgi:hypothetical protein
MHRFGIALLVGLLLTATAAGADVLEYYNGVKVQGTFLGGDADTLKFQVGDEIRIYKVRDIAAVHFEGARAVPAQAAGSPPRTIFIPQGAPLQVRMNEELNPKQGAGHTFTATMENGLDVGGRMIAPRGTIAHGVMTEAKKAGHGRGESAMRIALVGLEIQGRVVPIVTNQHWVNDLTTGVNMAAATVGAAALGGAIGGADSIGTGAAVGFGLSLASPGKQVTIPAGALIDFWLDQPVDLQI